MKFSKMQGIGNDYIYIDCINQTISEPSELAVRLSDRHFGIGADGIILICPSETADFRMRMFNADGSEGRMCGNGIRCFSRFVYDKGLTSQTELSIETLSGIKHCTLNVSDGHVESICVDMGTPVFECAQIPVISSCKELVDSAIRVGGKDYTITCVSIGNPHCVVFITDPVEDFPLATVGPLFENHPMFPDRVNTEFVNLMPDSSLRMRVWERGSGETWACGTGACAVLSAAVRNGIISGRQSVVHLRGGDLSIRWDGATGGVFMTGGAQFVFEGEVNV